MASSHRVFSSVLLVALTLVVLPACSSTRASRCYRLADGTCVDETFENPPVLRPDGDGVHQLYLDATEVEFEGARHCVRAYNGNYLAPTIETPAREGSAERSVRVDLANRLRDHDMQTLSGDACRCTTPFGVTCQPHDLHDACSDGHDENCTCVNEDGEACEHLVDFNVTNLHAHGSHVRPDYARGGEACAARTADGILYACRECGADTCDGDASDDTCFRGDDVLNAIHPQSGAQYRWDIDEDGTHHTGLQWYHPHVHGTTAMQVVSGAAGAWIIRGALDSLAGVADARERVMVFSTPPVLDNGFEPLADGERCTEDTLTFNEFAVLGAPSAPQLNVINGVVKPRLVTAPGQVERWRILHAGYLDEVFVGVFRGTDANCTDFSTADGDTLQLVQIGRDGLILPQAYSDDYVFMSPGYRVEAMVDGADLQDGDTWCVVTARFLQDGDPEMYGEFGEMPMSPPTPPTPLEVHARFDTDGQVVAILNVTADYGVATETEMPDLAAIAALAPPVDIGGESATARCAAAAANTDVEAIEQVAILQVGFMTVDDPDPCGCEGYNVNCANFESTDRERYPFDRDLPLGAIEHWRVGASIDGHPFHIHINPFLLCPDDSIYDPIPFPHWRDTVLLNTGRRTNLISEYRGFTGPFVLHCHKLTHEDEGMMEVLRVCDPATDSTCGDYGWRQCDADDLACAQQLASTDCYAGTQNLADNIACAAVIGGPTGVCGVNQCATTADCSGTATCEDHVCVPRTCGIDGDCSLAERCLATACVPASCPVPCMPGEACEHGVCQ